MHISCFLRIGSGQKIWTMKSLVLSEVGDIGCNTYGLNIASWGRKQEIIPLASKR